MNNDQAWLSGIEEMMTLLQVGLMGLFGVKEKREGGDEERGRGMEGILLLVSI